MEATDHTPTFGESPAETVAATTLTRRPVATGSKAARAATADGDGRARDGDAHRGRQLIG